MKTLIVYDTYFGNTKIVAEAIKNSLKGDINLVFVSDFNEKMLDGIDLLIVGSPTRAFNMSERTKKFIAYLNKLKIKDINAIVFDTRVDIKTVNSKLLTFLISRLGYAAEKIENKLKKMGANILIPHNGIFVLDKEGPLTKGETDKLDKWIKSIK